MRNLPIETPKYVQDILAPDALEKEEALVSSVRSSKENKVTSNQTPVSNIPVPVGPGTEIPGTQECYTPQPPKRRRLTSKQSANSISIGSALLLAATVATAAGRGTTSHNQDEAEDTPSE